MYARYGTQITTQTTSSLCLERIKVDDTQPRTFISKVIPILATPFTQQHIEDASKVVSLQTEHSSVSDSDTINSSYTLTYSTNTVIGVTLKSTFFSDVSPFSTIWTKLHPVRDTIPDFIRGTTFIAEVNQTSTTTRIVWSSDNTRNLKTILLCSIIIGIVIRIFASDPITSHLEHTRNMIQSTTVYSCILSS